MYAGVAFNSEGGPYPTAAGRYCEYSHETVDRTEEFDTFDEYFKTLRLTCDEGSPAYLNWTVPLDAPDVLYYQASTQNFQVCLH